MFPREGKAVAVRIRVGAAGHTPLAIDAVGGDAPVSVSAANSGRQDLADGPLVAGSALPHVQPHVVLMTRLDRPQRDCDTARARETKTSAESDQAQGAVHSRSGSGLGLGPGLVGNICR